MQYEKINKQYLTYRVKGNTYPIKDILKHEYHATWDSGHRAWVIKGRLSQQTLQNIRALSIENKIWIEIYSL